MGEKRKEARRSSTIFSALSIQGKSPNRKRGYSITSGARSRHHRNEFRGISFEGDTLRIYARIYARDLYLYGYTSTEQIPEMETTFVLSLGTGNENDDVYNELRDQLGAFVETALVETDIDVENQGT